MICFAGRAEQALPGPDHHRKTIRPRHKPFHLGNRVWLGAGATVLGATIGESAVVGTGGVVTSDVPPGVIVAGNPAQLGRKNVSWRL